MEVRDGIFAAVSAALLALGTELIFALPVALDVHSALPAFVAIASAAAYTAGVLCFLGMSEVSTGRLLLLLGVGAYGSQAAIAACLALGMTMADAVGLLLTATPSLGFVAVSALALLEAIRSA